MRSLVVLAIIVLSACGAVERALNTEAICDLHCNHAKCELSADKWICPR